jgi:arginine repressor
MNVFIGHKPNRQQMQAFNVCKQQGNESQIVKAVTEALAATKESLTTAEDTVRIHRLQGAAGVLKDFLDAVEISNEVLARLK